MVKCNRMRCVAVVFLHSDDAQRKIRRVAAWEGSDEEDNDIAANGQPPVQQAPPLEPAPRPRRRSDRQDTSRNMRMFGFLNATLKSASGRTATQAKAVRSESLHEHEITVFNPILCSSIRPV